jgi:hypothetical protein
VYASRASDVRATVIDGVLVARNGQVLWEDTARIQAAAVEAQRALTARAGIR